MASSRSAVAPLPVPRPTHSGNRAWRSASPTAATATGENGAVTRTSTVRISVRVVRSAATGHDSDGTRRYADGTRPLVSGSGHGR